MQDTEPKGGNDLVYLPIGEQKNASRSRGMRLSHAKKKIDGVLFVEHGASVGLVPL
jgi:hypothetical protein